eukprot:Clim_evm37s152 gene=Clim_evmTU37s152
MLFSGLTQRGVVLGLRSTRSICAVTRSRTQPFRRLMTGATSVTRQQRLKPATQSAKYMSQFVTEQKSPPLGLLRSLPIVFVILTWEFRHEIDSVNGVNGDFSFDKLAENAKTLAKRVRPVHIVYGATEAVYDMFTTLSGAWQIIIVQNVLFAMAGPTMGIISSLFRTAIILGSAKTTRKVYEVITDEDKVNEEQMDGLWYQWTPPGDTDNGTWNVIREIATVMEKFGNLDEALARHLENMPPWELAVAMYYYMDMNQGEKLHKLSDAEERLKKPTTGTMEAAQHYAYLADLAYVETEEEFEGKLPEGFQNASWTGQANWGDYDPAHYVIVNKKRKEVVIGIRGTKSLTDVVTDIAAVPEHMSDSRKAAAKEGEEEGDSSSWFSFGSTHDFYTHRGIGRAARKLLGRTRILVDLLNDKGYEVTVVGHSLGAGVGSVLSYLYRHEAGYRNVKCYAYATPACVDRGLASDLQSYVTSVVFRDDAVPRMTPHALLSFLEDLQQVDWQSLIQEDLDDNGSEWFKSFIGKLIEDLQQEGAYMKNVALDLEPLFIPGSILYLYSSPPVHDAEKESESDGKSLKEKPVKMVAGSLEADDALFANLVLSQHMISDHSCKAYIRILEKLNEKS